MPDEVCIIDFINIRKYFPIKHPIHQLLHNLLTQLFTNEMILKVGFDFNNEDAQHIRAIMNGKQIIHIDMYLK